MEMFHKRLIINDHRGLGHCDCSTIGYDKGDAIAFLLEYFHIPKLFLMLFLIVGKYI